MRDWRRAGWAAAQAAFCLLLLRWAGAMLWPHPALLEPAVEAVALGGCVARQLWTGRLEWLAEAVMYAALSAIPALDPGAGTLGRAMDAGIAAVYGNVGFTLFWGRRPALAWLIVASAWVVAEMWARKSTAVLVGVLLAGLALLWLDAVLAPGVRRTAGTVRAPAIMTAWLLGLAVVVWLAMPAHVLHPIRTSDGWELPSLPIPLGLGAALTAAPLRVLALSFVPFALTAGIVALALTAGRRVGMASVALLVACLLAEFAGPRLALSPRALAEIAAHAQLPPLHLPRSGSWQARGEEGVAPASTGEGLQGGTLGGTGFGNEGGFGGPRPQRAASTSQGAAPSKGSSLVVLAVVAALAVLGVAPKAREWLGALVRRILARTPAGRPTHPADPRGQVLAAYARVEASLAARGYARLRGVTVRMYAAPIVERGAPALRSLIALFHRARYSEEPVQESHAADAQAHAVEAMAEVRRRDGEPPRRAGGGANALPPRQAATGD